MSQQTDEPAFLNGGGHCGALIRALDWTNSPLGPPQTWPQPLRSTVSLMLQSRFPMFVAWGERLGFLYNDAYAEILGDKHPQALGRAFRDIWPEIWEDVGPLVDAALAGQTTYREDLPLTINRKGFAEPAWFTFSYSPVMDESGQVAGLFCACTETTSKVVAEQGLASERDRLEAVFESAPGYVAVLRGPQLVVESVNAAHRRDFLSADWIGRPIRDCVPSLEGQGYFEMLEQVYATGERLAMTGALTDLSRHPRGERGPRQYYDFVFAPLLDATGAVTGVYTEVFDVTGRHLLEEARRESQRELELLTDALPVLISYVDRDLVYRFANKAYEAWFPLRREDLVGRPVPDVIGEAAFAKVKPHLDAVLSGERVTYDERVPYREGTRDVRVELVPRSSPEGDVIGYYALVRDISDQVGAEIALAEKAAELESVLEAAPVAIWVANDRDAVRIEGNAFARQLLGVDRQANMSLSAPEAEKPTGFAVRDPVLGRMLEPSELPVQRAARGEVVTDFEMEIVFDDNRVLSMVGNCRPLYGLNGELRGAVAAFADITARRRAEDAVRESEQRLRFLDELGSATAGGASADEILATTTRMVGEHMGASVCAYADMDEDQEGFTIRGDWAGPGETNIVGRYRLSDFGSVAVERLSAGQPLVLSDIPNQIDPHGAATFGAIGIQATICMPLVKEGRLTALMAVHHSRPHDWTEAEQALVAEVVARSWAHVERVGAEASLRESDARLRALTDNLPVAMVYQAETSRDLSWRRYTYVSANAPGLTGVPVEDALSDPGALISYISSEDWPAVAAAEIEASRELKMLDIDLAATLQDGSRRHFHCYSQPRLQADGTLIWDGLLLDITARHAAEQALRESEEQLRFAMEAGRLGQATFDVATGAIEHTSAFAALFGFAEDARLTLDDLRRRYHPEDRERILRFRDAQLAAGSNFYEADHRIVLPGGEVRWLLARGSPERDESGRIVRVTAFYLDETDRRQAQDALRTNEERLRLAAKAADIGAWDLNLITGQGFWDEEALRVAGLAGSDPAFNATTWTRLCHPDDRARADQAFQAALEPDGPAYAIDFRGAAPAEDGGVRWLTSHGAIIRDEAGRAIRAVGVIRDVTHRRRAEAEIRASEARFRALADAMPQLVWTADPDGLVDYYNGRSSEYAGLTRDAEGTYAWAPIVHPDDMEHTVAAWREASQTGSLYTCEHRLKRVDGGWAWHVSRGVPRFDASGAIAKWYGTATDIHALKAAQEATEALNAGLERRIAESVAEKRLLADLVENTDAFVQVADLDLNWLALNRAAADEFERVLGVRPKVGDNMRELLAGQPEHRAAVEAIWTRAMTSERFTAIDQFGDPSLDRRYYEMRFNPLFDAEGRRIGAYQFVYDVTERLQDQARLAQVEEALRQGQKMQAVGQLAGGIAHDFNNLLGAIVGSLDLVRRRSQLDERTRRFVDNAFTAAERGAKLTSQLLAFARAQKLELKPLIVSDLVSGMEELLSRTLGPQVRLELKPAEGSTPVLSDATQLEMAVLNLAINARDAMPDGGALTVSTRLVTLTDDPELAPGDYVELAVADTGQGMPAEVVARAFDPFFTTKGIGQGTGLGLSQVYGIAQQAGGTARIDSRPGEGTTVRLFLRRTELPIMAGGVDDEAAHGPGGRSARVVVVDDDPELRRFLADSLDTLGYAVEEAADGAQGLKLIEATAPDLVILDYAMPGMTGAEVARQVRAARPDLPILFASGYADTAAIEAVMGADARILRKPFRLHELQAMLADALG